MVVRKIAFLLVTVLGAATVWGGFTDVKEWTSTSGWLVNGRINRISSDKTFSSTENGYCPMRINEGVTSVIWIERGKTLRLRGGDASGVYAASPGILFNKPNATLIIAGHGTLEVTGGNGGNGVNGSNGEKNNRDGEDMACGAGGAGGAGGGAASPGIGGISGNGGGGAEKNSTSREKCTIHSGWNRVDKAGNKPGDKGTDGDPGGDNGTIYVIGTVTVKAAHGTGGASGEGGKGSDADTDCYVDKNGGDDYFSGPGGGGGGGGGGSQPLVAIGGGVGGAGGGGSGATGTTIGTQDYNNGGRYGSDTPHEAWMIGGYGGSGGRSDSAERSGEDGTEGSLAAVRKQWGSDTITLTDEGEGQFRGSRSPYPGGGPGMKGNNGANGKVYLMNSAKLQALVSGQSVAAQDSIVSLNETTLLQNGYSSLPDAVKYTLYLQNSGGERTAMTVALGCRYPNITIPTREHYVFKGYYERPNRGGACYYDASGRWMLGEDYRYYDRFADQTLYAAWELVGESSDTFEVKAGETLVVDEMSGAEEYIQDAEKPLFTVRRGGKLILNNLMFLGEEMSTAGLIRNFGEVVVSNCAFTSCFSRKGRGGVYRDFPGAQALFIRCSFVSCGALEGGAIAAEGSRVSVISSTFAFNGSLADTSVHNCLGAAVYSDTGSDTRICDCTFVANVAARSPGTVLAYIPVGSMTPSGCVLNNVFEMDSSCCLSVTNRPVTCAYNFRTKTSASADAIGDWCRTVDGTVTLASPRAVNGVEHTYYKVLGQLRTLGIAQQIYPQAEWPNFVWNASGSGEPMRDILEEWPLDGYAGARTGNELQRLIDLTPAGGTLTVAPHIYDGVTINKRITIIGQDLASTIVSGDAYEPCVRYQAGGENATWVNFTFADGKNANGNGGGWTSDGDVDRGVASNCIFRSCTAANGGGAANAKTVVDSVFVSCTASNFGGGTYSCADVYRTYYYGNNATTAGGGASGDLRTYSSLFLENATSGDGGGASNGDCSFCTFARNSASSDSSAGASASRVFGCLFYGHAVPSDAESTVEYSKQLYGSSFVDAKASGSSANFHLALRDSNGNKLTHDDVRLSNARLGSGLLDFEKLPLVSTHPVSGEKYLYAGCYAFSPFKTSGLVVTGREERYPDSNVLSSLREAVEAAEDFASETNGQMVVSFSPTLFEYEDTSVFPLSSAQIDLCAFTNATLVVRGPTNKVAVIDGSKTSRAFRIFAGNRVIFENLVFQNCFGDIYGKKPQPGCNGGAVLNCGNAFFSNCVFRANRAGNRVAVPNEKAPVGYGGAISTEAGGTSTVYAATFAGNCAAKGGAVWTADGGASRIYYSTFAGNIADGDGATDAMGGACAQERKTAGATGSQLWLVNCTLAGNRVTKYADSGGAISGANSGLVLLNSIVVGNYAANATNDIAMPSGSTSHFYYTAYGTRTPPPKTSYLPSQITYVDLCSTGGVAYLDAIGLTNDMPIVKLPMPQTVLPLAKSFAINGTNVWTTTDFATLGYGGTTKTSVQVLAGGSRYQLFKSGVMRVTNILGESQRTNGVVRLGPATITGASLRGDDEETEESGNKPTYDDEDQVAATNGVCYLVKIDGTTNYYPSVETAVKHWQPGDYTTVCSDENEALNEKFFDVFDTKLMAYVETHRWYDYVYVGDDILKLALTLNAEKAEPEIKGDFDVTSTKDKVSVQIENVKPCLWYSLGRADSPEGPYVCEKWVQADDEGKLKDFLTAPKSGDKGFYRVIVAPYVK